MYFKNVSTNLKLLKGLEYHWFPSLKKPSRIKYDLILLPRPTIEFCFKPHVSNDLFLLTQLLRTCFTVDKKEVWYSKHIVGYYNKIAHWFKKIWNVDINFKLEKYNVGINQTLLLFLWWKELQLGLHFLWVMLCCTWLVFWS